MNRATARGAVVTLAAIVAAVITHLTIPEVGAWWDGHSLIASFVTSLLILGVTVQVVDQVAARRKVKERERVAAVQALIVYSQAMRTGRVLMARGDERQGEDPTREVQAAASMVLVAAPALFDDPTARDFMDKVEQYSTLLYRTVRSRADTDVTDADRAKVSESEKALTTAVH